MLGKKHAFQKIILLLFLALYCQNTFAQAKEVLKTNPIAIGFGIYNLEYERGLNSNSSICIGAVYYYKKYYSNKLAAWAQYRYYFFNKLKPTPTGLYLATTFAYGNSDGEKLGLFGFSLGYQWLKEDGSAIELAIGPHYPIGVGDDASTVIVPFFNIGYHW